MKDDRVYLGHIWDSIARIDEYTAVGKAAFLGDRKCQDAVVRNLEIIGEAAKNVSRALRAAHPEVPWRSMTGMRDKIAHEYFGVDLRIVWMVVERELPKVKKRIAAILEAA